MTVPDATPDDVTALAEELWADSASPGAAPTDAHHEQARVVLASSWLAQRDARIRAEALRDAANDANRIHCGYPTNPQIRSVNAIRRWLYERADRIEALP